MEVRACTPLLLLTSGRSAQPSPCLLFYQPSDQGRGRPQAPERREPAAGKPPCTNSSHRPTGPAGFDEQCSHARILRPRGFCPLQLSRPLPAGHLQNSPHILAAPLVVPHSRGQHIFSCKEPDYKYFRFCRTCGSNHIF